MRLLIVLTPVFFCFAAFVWWGRLEDQNSHFRTAWQEAVWGDTVAVKKMLDAGEIDKEDLECMLRMAADTDDDFGDRAVKTLLELGVHSDSKDSEGHTALQIAENKGNRKTARLLHQAEVRASHEP